MSIAISILLAVVLVLLGILQFWSYPGKPKPYLDQNGHPLAGSISEKVFINVNGVQQGMFIKGKDVSKPVLLYLHGGMPDYFLAEKYPTGLEDQFIVVWWEQRGSGISYSRDLARETLNLDQMVSDTLDVTNYLRKRFGKEKIYLMGHSGGTFIGIQAAARAPELYYAYIGVSQMVNQLQSEKIAYDYMLEQFKANGDTTMLQKLEAAPVTIASGTPASYLVLRDIAMHSLGIGTMHDMRSVVTGIILPSFQSPDYTLREKVNMWRGKAQSGVASLWDEMISTDLCESLPEINVPVYFFEGNYDYTVNPTLARAYFEELHAPVKGFYRFEYSAHSPIFEEPQKVQRIVLEDVLTGKNDLSDIQ
jgi:pimeloyl-ACP methyl ester carboxylesterase